jgi:hypothetical protein
VRSEDFGGYDVVAMRPITAGEIVVSEVPLLEASAPDSNEVGWATAIMRTFCSSSKAVQIAVLATTAVGQHEAAANSAHREMCVGAAREVALCADLPWRRAHPDIADSTLASVCLIAQLNSYAFGAGRTALFQLGCQMNHACDSNVRYSSTAREGRGSFVARRDIAMGESLCTNYIGETSGIRTLQRPVLCSAA